MKITAEVIIRGTKYVIETDGVVDGADGVKRVIAKLENPDVVLDPSYVGTVKVKH